VLLIAPFQSELPLRVAVCAWCKPKNRSIDLGAGLGAISHGICPRHLKKLRLELQMMERSTYPTPASATHSRRRGSVLNHPELLDQA
jgi:hypothetical protein